MPRVDAIGGSAAGIYIDDRVRVASLFRSVPESRFAAEVEPMFARLGEEWGVPIRVINDGDVAALAGAMALGRGGILGIAMGSSEAAGYLDHDCQLTGWLNELGFAPVDGGADAPVEEWSGDRGVGTSYFSQQAIERLAHAAGIELAPDLGLAEKLVIVQELAEDGDQRAGRVFETVGAYLGHAVPWYRVFYDFDTVLILGRVTSGVGGELLVREARRVLEDDYPELADRVVLRLPDETTRRVGQAVAAASLPMLAG
ncbi:MAG: ROK family protein [Acidobacteria bacterium]|nr:ROK family protein [Acidobacteriota bacterium]